MTHPLLLPEVNWDTLPGGGLTIQLPRRDLNGFRWLPVFLLVMAVGIVVFMAFWIVGFAGGMQQTFGPAGLFSALLGLPGLLGGGALVGVAMALQFGHTELTVADGWLTSTERAGPFRWRRTIAAEHVRQLMVSQFSTTDSQGRKAFYEMSAMLAERSRGKPFVVAVGYPRPLLLAIADRLAIDMRTEAVSEPGTQVPTIDVVDVSETSPGEMDRLEQPADSAIVYLPLADGLTLSIPPRGVWHGSSGLFSFSLVWLGFMVVFTGFLVFGGFVAPMPPMNGWEWVFFGGISSLFWLIGIGMLLAAINMGRRQAVIGVTQGELKLMTISPFRTTRKDWPLSALQTVRVGPSGMSVNDVPVMQLHIVSRDGQPFGLLTGRDERELEWMATLLRQAARAGKTA